MSSEWRHPAPLGRRMWPRTHHSHRRHSELAPQCSPQHTGAPSGAISVPLGAPQISGAILARIQSGADAITNRVRREWRRFTAQLDAKFIEQAPSSPSLCATAPDAKSRNTAPSQRPMGRSAQHQIPPVAHKLAPPLIGTEFAFASASGHDAMFAVRRWPLPAAGAYGARLDMDPAPARRFRRALAHPRANDNISRVRPQ